MKNSAHLAVLVLVMIAGLYSLDYAYNYAEQSAFGESITGAVSGGSETKEELQERLVEQLYVLYHYEGKLSYEQYLRAYDAITNGYVLPTDVAAVLPKKNTRTLTQQYLTDKTITSAEFYAADFYSSLWYFGMYELIESQPSSAGANEAATTEPSTALVAETTTVKATYTCTDNGVKSTTSKCSTDCGSDSSCDVIKPGDYTTHCNAVTNKKQYCDSNCKIVDSAVCGSCKSLSCDGIKPGDYTTYCNAETNMKQKCDSNCEIKDGTLGCEKTQGASKPATTEPAATTTLPAKETKKSETKQDLCQVNTENTAYVCTTTNKEYGIEERCVGNCREEKKPGTKSSTTTSTYTCNKGVKSTTGKCSEKCDADYSCDGVAVGDYSGYCNAKTGMKQYCDNNCKIVDYTVCGGCRSSRCDGIKPGDYTTYCNAEKKKKQRCDSNCEIKDGTLGCEKTQGASKPATTKPAATTTSPAKETKKSETKQDLCQVNTENTAYVCTTTNKEYGIEERCIGNCKLSTGQQPAEETEPPAESPPVSVPNPPAAAQQNGEGEVINLVEGFNLISLPLSPSNKKIEVVTASINEYLETVSYYDADKFLVYRPSLDTDTLLTLEPGKGYIVKMKKAAELRLEGTPYEFQPIVLNSNKDHMIGAPSSSVKLKDVLGSCNINKIRMTSVNTEGVQTSITVNSETALQPGKGYWIKSSESCELGEPLPVLLEPKPEPAKASGSSVDLVVEVAEVMDVNGNPVAELFAGVDYRVKVVVKNQGGGKLPVGSAFYTLLYLDAGAANRRVRVDSYALSSVDFNQNQKAELVSTWKVPETLQAGEYELLAIADTQSVITEMKEDNNEHRKPVTIKEGGGGNLAVEKVEAVPRAGNVFDVKATVKNDGRKRVYIGDKQQATESGVGVITFVRVDAVIKKGGSVVCSGNGFIYDSLEAGASVDVQVYIKKGSGQCALERKNNYAIEVAVDSNGIIEASKDDNEGKAYYAFGFDSALKCPGTVGKDIPFGFRQGNTYCEDGKLVAQKSGGQSCSNSFECLSNVCAAGECIESSAFKKLLCSLGLC